jgi:O-antigen ligase
MKQAMMYLESLFLNSDRRPTAAAIGIILGIGGVVLGFLVVYAGVLPTFALVFALIAGVYVLTSLEAALIALMVTVALIPFGTLPFKVAFTPSLIEMALGGFLLVYAFQWMTGRRRDFRLTPVSWTILVLLLLMVFAFILGLRGDRPTPNQLKTFVGLLGCISMGLILADVASDLITLRRVTLILLLVGTLTGLIGIALWVLPDLTAETLLNRLGRIGYPVGGVIRYREDGVQIGRERAIGTWIDPNAFGGFLLMMGGLGGAQLFSRRPVMGWRWLVFACFGVIGLALFLTDSRGSALGLLTGLGIVAVLRDRRLLWLGLAGALVAFFLPPVQAYLDKFYAGITAADLETQMRLGEYKDALTLIGRHPLFGVGFTGVPDIDLYVGFANTYLTIASYAGLVGLAAFGLVIGCVIGWGLRWWRVIRHDEGLNDIWLGLLAGIIGALVGGMFDHFYFNPQYQATAMLLWSFVGMFLAATRIVWERGANPMADAR